MDVVRDWFTELPERPVSAFKQLVAHMRPNDVDDFGSTTAIIQALCYQLDHNPDMRESMRGALRILLTESDAGSLYAESGILPNEGLFTELWQRLSYKLLPPVFDENSLKDNLHVIFPKRMDGEWLANIPDEVLRQLLRAIRFDEVPGQFDRAWLAILDSLLTISCRIAGIGVEPELMRHFRIPTPDSSPFVAQLVEVRVFVEVARMAIRDGQPLQDDARHIDVLFAQGEEVVQRIRRDASKNGTSIRLTTHLLRLGQLIARARMLLAMVEDHIRPAGDGSQFDRMAGLFRELVAAECDRYNLRAHIRQSAGVLALEVTERASRTGEHYVTTTRAEYWRMFRSALGAGAMIPFMALLKVFIAGAKFPPLIEALLFSLNYGLGFMLIYVMQFTIATKQPAMTASHIAATLETVRGKRVALGHLADMIACISRTQLIAIAGNVLLALPVAFVLALLWSWLAGVPIIASPKASLLVQDIHPWHSLALIHAAIAGVWLFLSGLISGYYDNLALYSRISDRLRQVGWLKRLIGPQRLQQFSNYVGDHLGGLAGNFFFGFLLGSTGFVGHIIGLPLDIRHIAFASANVGLSLEVLGGALAWQDWLVALFGVLLIGAINLAVSFSLALSVALRSRQVSFQRGGELLGLLWQMLRQRPRAFFLPPPRLHQGESSSK